MDILFFAIVAGLVLARLYQVLGQNHGAPPPIVKDKLGEKIGAPSSILGASAPSNLDAIVSEDENSVVSERFALEQKYGDLFAPINETRKIFPDFDPIVFEQNATNAYEAIISAYSLNDETSLSPLVSDEVLGVYRELMLERAKKDSKKIEIIKLADPIIRQIDIKQDCVEIDVYFNATLKEAANAPIITQEVWTFSRIIRSNSPIWRLIAVETA